MRDGRAVEYMHYLMVSALSLDTRTAACAALVAGRCSIYERRPLACRTVPLHYTRAEALAGRELDAFVATPGYACDTGERAPVVIDGPRIVDVATINARREALAVAQADRAWKQALARHAKGGRAAHHSLPSLDDIEANAPIGAMTTSMRVGWQIAAEGGLISPVEYRRLVETQLRTIERELERAQSSAADMQTLQEMSAEYRQALAFAAASP